jgi:hypothetical protein
MIHPEEQMPMSSEGTHCQTPSAKRKEWEGKEKRRGQCSQCSKTACTYRKDCKVECLSR